MQQSLVTVHSFLSTYAVAKRT